MRVDQPAGGGRGGRPTSSPAHAAGQLVEVVEGGVALGVHDQMHVLGPADQPKLGHALVRGNHQLHAWPAGRHQLRSAFGMAGAARSEDRLVPFRRHRTVQAERLSPAPAPAQRGLPPGRVVGQRHAWVVVAPFEDRVPVVRDRLRAHHPHPGHRPSPPPAGDLPVGNPSGCNRVGLLNVIAERSDSVLMALRVDLLNKCGWLLEECGQ